MTKIYVRSDEIKNYMYYIVLFNAVFPNILEQSGLMLWVEDPIDENQVQCLSYENFIEYYDHYGLNRVAQ